MTSWPITVLVAVAAAGCIPTATVPISAEAAKPVPAERIFQRELTVPGTGRTAKLRFIRDAGALGSACTHRIVVDGELALGIRSGERQMLYVTPGRHSLELQIAGNFICPGLLSTPLETDLPDGAEETYRILMLFGNPPVLVKIGATPGAAESPMPGLTAPR
jgi:hypothetical protein